MTHPTLYLLRHGQTDWNRDRRIQGQRESRLTDLGREQASAQGRILAGLGLPPGTRAFVSPLWRTRETAELALAPAGLVPIFDDRLKEVGMGVWEGRMWADLLAERGASETDIFDLCLTAPGGEDIAAMTTRIGAFIDELRGLTDPVVVVSHGIALCVLRGLLRGLDHAELAALDRPQGVVIELEAGAERLLS